MIELDRSYFIHKSKEVWFAESPFDVKGYNSVFFNCCKNKIGLEGFKRIEGTTLTVDLTQDLETIWHNMSKSSCRYAINKAKRDGVVSGYTSITHRKFWEMNEQFRKDKGLPESNKSLQLLNNSSVLFVAYHNSELIAGQVYLFDNNIIRWMEGASKRLEVDKDVASLIGNANRLLIWKAIQYAKDKGTKTFDLGGYCPEVFPAVSAFKKSFGGVVTPYYNYVKIYSKLLKTLKVII